MVALAPSTELGALAALLDTRESHRAAAFRFDRDRQRYICAHGALRLILGAYCGCPPAALVVEGQDGEKPRLAGTQTGWDLHFNLSHSEDLMALAVSDGLPLGIDVEAIRPFAGMLESDLIGAAEAALIRTLPEPAAVDAWFRCWARKEAYLKARGDGLATHPESFEIAVGADAPPRLLSHRGLPGEEAHWQIRDIDSPPGFAGALAARCQGWRAVPIG
jgi:4'-phosphopantetheinyl transferase